MNYYILSEDIHFPYAMELGDFPETIDKRAIATMELQYLNNEPVEIELKEGLSDISTYMYPIISQDIKDIFDREELVGIFYKPLILIDGEDNYLYYLMLPKRLDCISYVESGIEKTEMTRINKGFYLKENSIGNMRVFGLDGILNRLIIIDKGIKEALEKEKLVGIKITDIRDYKGD